MKKINKLGPLALIIVFFLSFTLLGQFAAPSRFASAQDAPFNTATPDANGYIYHTVRENEYCYTIAELYNTSVERIISLNNLDLNCTIFVGRTLLVAIVTATAVPPTAEPVPAQPTVPPQEAQPTQPPADFVPEPTAMLDTGKVCIILFHDVDGNGMRTDGENFLYGGEVSINDRTGTVSRVSTTVAGDPDTTKPMCFEQLPPGEYNISIAVPDGFNNTTATNHAITVVSGETITIDFGAQEATPEDMNMQGEARALSPLLFILGGVILLSGLGLLFYMIRARKR
ncbi:MAG TPA: LysM peptidoglycan-binding domain-containing protein [Anaerolineaceae bacterium]|nr:LysM peptidoglycan-binding domain-containing protein [Anaerolineaceae bacterium]HQN68369.1 LysM peptidoglycan-binding domain-containing protein [Anaerolineaceae bacterium]